MIRCLAALGRTTIIMVLALCIGIPESHAQEVRVFQQKPFLRRGRVELAPLAGTSINDAMIRHISTGGTLYYHATENWAVGASYLRTFGTETSLYEKVMSDYSLLPRIMKTDALMTGQVSYAFLYGKFALFNTWVIHFDTTAQLGLGAAQTQAGDFLFAGDYGIGQRFYLLDWLSLNLEVRHYVINDDSLFHNVTAAAGVGFFVPFHFDYANRK